MKCAIKNEKTTRIMLAAGLLLLAIGITAAVIIGEESGQIARMMGFVSGLGGAIAAAFAFMIIRRRIIGPERSADNELEMSDERGRIIAYKAQSVFALTALVCIVILTVVATARGDELYMLIGAGSCLVCAAARSIAAAVYGRRM